MLVTNGKRIVVIPNTGETEEIQKKLKQRAKDNLGSKAKFTIKEDPYEYMECDVTFEELKKIAYPDMDVQFRALGAESVMKPETVIRDIKHVYDQGEKEVIANELCNIQYDKEQKEAEAKAEAKKFKNDIDKMETKISDLASRHRQGYEMKSTECNLHLDFENGNRVYTDLDSKETLHIEPLRPEDYQLKLDFNDGVFEAVEVVEATEAGENPGEE